jgi:osmotically inducible protein OsmC
MQLIIRKASVRWVTGAHGGRRSVTTDSRVLDHAPFSAGRQRRRNSDTNSAELIAAAHAGSFSLALADELGRKARGAGEIVIAGTVTVECLPAGWTITNIHLNVIARLPRLSQGDFIDATVRAKTKCLVSRALRATVSMNAKLEKLSPDRPRPTSRPSRSMTPRRAPRRPAGKR